MEHIYLNVMKVMNFMDHSKEFVKQTENGVDQNLIVKWLAVGYSLTRVSSYLRLVSRMNLYLRVGVHFGTRTQYSSFQTPLRYPLSLYPSLLIMLVNKGDIKSILTVCTYANMRLINCSPNH
ncbi:unnamed protein product [Schistosoma margrebowiei]|uniref:Uncharacterized protein n=1 Tax=Schistosoma margrebowiei TaxID=48269 RepID=A0A183MTW0_9TREM|nr:unnamed protein product [Schistosoma margrebowiei]